MAENRKKINKSVKPRKETNSENMGNLKHLNIEHSKTIENHDVGNKEGL